MSAGRYLLAIALLISAAGDAEIETHKKSCATGDSILFPGLKNGTSFTDNMIYELRKVGASPGWLMMVHGEAKVHKFYEARGIVFPENKSFLLTNLTKEDDGVYEQKLNQKTLLQVILTVIDPVEQPTLTRQDDNETCCITLMCVGGKGDTSNITFLRNEVEITRNTSLDDNLLVIDGTDPQQWGFYMCSVRNLVSQKVSQKLELIPKGMAGESLFFYVSCIGGIVYICHLLCLLLTNKSKKLHLENVLLYSICVCAASMELCVFSISIYLFNDLRDQLSSGAAVFIISIMSVILLVRGLWLFMFCGVPLQSGTIPVMEDALLAADLLLAPAVFIQYMCLYLQALDLCGKKREQGLRTLLYLVIGFVTLLALLLLLRRLWMTCRPSEPPDPDKGSFTPAPVEEATTDTINEEGRKNEEEALTIEEAAT